MIFFKNNKECLVQFIAWAAVAGPRQFCIHSASDIIEALHAGLGEIAFEATSFNQTDNRMIKSDEDANIIRKMFD